MSISSVLNNFIGLKWTFIGFGLMMAGLLWLLGAFFSDAFQALIVGVPIPADPVDFIFIFGLLFIGGFCLAWGQAMLRRQEWGAFAGGLVRLVLTFYLLLVAFIFFQNPDAWLPASVLDLYNRYFWLVWAIFGLGIVWLVSTWAWLLFNKNRRDKYALAYRDSPPSASSTCSTCGLILKDKFCPECNKPKREAWLIIGQRRERLEFIPSKDEPAPAFVIGRLMDKNEAYLTLSDRDTARPERISSRHALIQYHFDYKQFTIQDLASLNNTYLNDELLLPNKPYRLEHEARINLAKEIDLIFECD